MHKPDEAVGGKKDYWQSYYSARKPSTVPIPSQFAVFVAGEMMGKHQVFDIGCGGGRDSLFFASHGHDVIGMDGSQAAVDNCTGLASSAGLPNARFVCASVGDALSGEGVDVSRELPRVVYARFFLHAITEQEEAKFLELASALAADGGSLAVEFRTMRDVAQEKVTESHYRRFIDPVLFNARALRAGFEPRYFVEGFGFAKFKNDDAHVARFIFDRARE